MSKMSEASSERSIEKNVENNLMLTLELIWEDSITLKVIYNVISAMMRNSMIARDLRLKRIYAKFRGIINAALQSLTAKEIDHETCTWEVFEENLKNKGRSVDLEQLSFTDVEETAFVNAYVFATKDMFISNLEERNNLHLNTIEKVVPESEPTIDEEPEYKEMAISILKNKNDVDVPTIKNEVPESKPTVSEEPGHNDELGEVMIIDAESNTEVESMNIIDVKENSNINGREEEDPQAGTSTDQNTNPESPVPPKRQCRIETNSNQAEIEGVVMNKNLLEIQRDEVKKVVNWMREVSTAPINYIFNTLQWHDGPYKQMPTCSPVVKAAIVVRQVELSKKGLLEIFLELRMNKRNDLLFSCPVADIRDYYYNVVESIAMLERFLYLQYITEHEVSAFLDRLVEILDKRNPDINAMFVSGDPKSGKDFFFNCVICALLNYGVMGNLIAQNQYPLKDCINKRVLLWSNPSIVASAEAGLKLLFRGERVSTRVNAKNCAVIQRTPIIILSNEKMFHKNRLLEQHIYYEQWKKCTSLPRLSKKPYPLAVYYLLIKWKKIFVNDNLAKLDAKELKYIQ